MTKKNKPPLFGPQILIQQQSTEAIEAALKNGIAAHGSALESWLKEELENRKKNG